MSNIIQTLIGSTADDYKTILKDLADRIRIDITPFVINITCRTYNDNNEVVYKFKTPKIYERSYNNIETIVSKWVDDNPMSDNKAIVNIITKSYITAAIYDYTKQNHNILNDDNLSNSINIHINENEMIEISCSFLPESCPKYYIDPTTALTNNFAENVEVLSDYIDNTIGDNIPNDFKELFKLTLLAKYHGYVAYLLNIDYIKFKNNK